MLWNGGVFWPPCHEEQAPHELDIGYDGGTQENAFKTNQ